MAAAAHGRGQDRSAWEYIRVDGLGLLPALVCPHHDRTQSNGVRRAVDFDAMLRRHPGERGLCLDHWAALVVDGPRYRVVPVPGKGGSAAADGAFTADPTLGVPAVWVKQAAPGGAGGVVATRVPAAGLVADLLAPATAIVADPRLPLARAANPQPPPP